MLYFLHGRNLIEKSGLILDVVPMMQEVPNDRAWVQKLASFMVKFAGLSILTIAYFMAARLGLSLAFVNPSATAVWPPTGIALAAFLIIGDQAAIGILAGAILANISISGSIPSSIAIGIGNALEGYLGAYLVRRFAGGPDVFNRTVNVFKYTFFAGILSTAVSATIGVSSIVWDGLAQVKDFAAIWLTWWLGDAGGNLIIAPVLILLATIPKIRWNLGRLVELILLFCSTLLVALIVFSSQSIFALRHYPLEFALVPIVIWAAYRFGQRETSVVTLIFSAIAIAGTLNGFGPFTQAEPNESLLLLQSFTMTVAVTGLSLAALVSERREAENELNQMNRKLRQGLDRVEEHNLKMLLLNEMGDLLQSCTTFEEAYTIIGQFGVRILPEETGILYIINSSQNIMEAAVGWGRLETTPTAFALDDCWALRRGRRHDSIDQERNSLELVCPHVKEQNFSYSTCIPMMAHGDSIGVLHVRGRQKIAAESEHIESTQQLAAAMADTISLALANLKLRLSLREQSIRDSLTGLFNRRYLDETLEREFRRAVRTRRSVGVIMLDLDHFKQFNDEFGHDAGDVMLRKLGAFLKQHLRGGDIACRYGGEEFALVMPEAPLENVRQRAEQLRDGIKNLTVQYRDSKLTTLTLSIGIAMFPQHGETSQQVLIAADEALYMAKGQGRDCVVIAPMEHDEKLPLAE